MYSFIRLDNFTKSCFFGILIWQLFNITLPASSSHDCGERYLNATDSFKTFESPGYPVRYDNSMDCKWTIKATNTSCRVYVDVVRSSMERRNPKSGLCSFDSVSAYDGRDISSRKMQTWCENETMLIQSTERYLTLRMKTDQNVVGQGFSLLYKQTSAPDPRGEYVHATENTQYLTSPGYPSVYEKNFDCTWRIVTTDSDYVVFIEILNINIEPQFRCSADYLQAFDGSDDSGTSLGKWCGALRPSAVYSSGQSVFIKFHSDDDRRWRAHTYNGFKLEYSSKAKPNTSTKSNRGAIIGGVSATIILLLVGIFCVVGRRARKKGRRQHQPEPCNRPRTSSSPQPRPTQTIVFFIQTDDPSPDTSPPDTSAPPPSYSEVMAKDEECRNEAPPPPYSSVVKFTLSGVNKDSEV